MSTHRHNKARSTQKRRALSPALLALRQEIITYRRELPRPLAEGNEGRVALIKGDQLLSVWDSDEDAYQAGLQQFGLDGTFLAQPIDSRDLTSVFPEELTA